MQNFSNNGDGQVAAQDKSRQKNTIQRDIIMAESDYRKFSKEKTVLEAEIRALKKDEAQIKVGLQDKRSRLGKVEYEVMQLEVALKNLKKKLYLNN